MNPNDVLAAARRCETVWWEQICEWEPLDYGVAFTCPRYPELTDAQQLRDVWLADIDGSDAFDRAETYFADRNLQCAIWTPAPGQPEAPVEAVMIDKGWQRENIIALNLADIDKSPAELEREDMRVLPARAMRRAYRTFLESLHDGETAACDAAFDRLDDASYEVLLAVRDGVAVARIGYHEVGEFARLRDFSVTSDADDNDSRSLLLAHFLLRARRLSPRVVVACFPEAATDEIAFLTQRGFADAGRLVRFRRPA
ncbi:MAG: hypothetical protein H6819_02825 [Phycisphaerales bacterium]|nr:hypothetical protein [Phycisphaerales bacterium]MCB9856853.1 hypothetical protein [Phycisphaerales bacterium]MCB9862020.1 hypothetical protein [Phycisphaerales bacterium]